MMNCSVSSFRMSRATAAWTSGGKRGCTGAHAACAASTASTIHLMSCRGIPPLRAVRYTSHMPVFRLDDRLVFPPVHLAEDGLLALGGDLRPERLLLGYTQGIFPWYAENLPILWHSPDPRMIMTTRDLVVQRSLRKAIRRKPYRLTMDHAFGKVLEGCAAAPRPGQTGTWL